MWRIEYFEALTQIGPVILLAYILEERFHRGDDNARLPQGRHVTRLAGLTLTLLAEVVALAVVAGVVPPARSTGELIGAGLMLGVSYLIRALTSEGRRPAVAANAAVGLLFTLGALALLVLSFF